MGMIGTFKEINPFLLDHNLTTVLSLYSLKCLHIPKCGTSPFSVSFAIYYFYYDTLLRVTNSHFLLHNIKTNSQNCTLYNINTNTNTEIK